MQEKNPRMNTFMQRVKSTSSRRSLILVFALFASLFQWRVSFGQVGDGIEETQSSFITNASISNAIPWSTGMVAVQYTPGTEFSKTIKNVISFRIHEETTTYIPADFTCSLQVLIEYGHNSSSLQQTTQTFTIEYKKNAGVKYNAKNYFSFDGAEYVRITALNANSLPVVGGVDTKTLVILENKMINTRFYQLSNQSSNLQPSPFTATATADELTVSWGWPAAAGNNYTQVEWAWLETELAGNYPSVNGHPDFDKLFDNNASRVDLPLSRTTYSIPLLYDGVGTLYYRIRAVSINKTTGRIDGPWVYPVSGYAFNGHNNNLNWQATTSFAEEGKRKSVVAYFDGTLRSRQTVTKDNTTNTVVSSETLYDGEGRPAIQILPTPGTGTVLQYTSGLNLFKSNTSLNLPSDQTLSDDPVAWFDLEPVATPMSLTPELKTTSGASNYYSASNSNANTGADKYIPDAEGYPYTVTRYTPDASGRIMSQSGVGSTFKMGSGHETKYYYGSPAQVELDALFGTEVGNFTHYFKTMVKDANGQMSVSYTDMHGRTIATALAGDAPSNLTALNQSQYGGNFTNSVTRNLLDNNSNVVKGNAIESINSLLVPATNTYTFNYALTPQSLQMASCSTGVNLCYTCLYDLELVITDESGDAAPIVKRFKNISLNPGDACPSSPLPFTDLDNSGWTPSNTINFSQVLAPGSYTIRKTLTVNENYLQQYDSLYIQKALCKTQQQIIDSIYNVLLSVSDCHNPVPLTCTSCLAALGDSNTFQTNYLNSIGNPTLTPQLHTEIMLAWRNEQAHCNMLCSNNSGLLNAKRQLMLSDMTPYSGQYAFDSLPVGTTPLYLYNTYNIFSTYNSSTQPFYKKPWNSNYQLDYYHTSSGDVDVSIHPGGNYTLLNQTTANDFEQMFSSSWAEALLPHHPEYPKLKFAENNLVSSYNWMASFTGTSTYADASTAGYIFTSSANINDPFYNVSGAGGYKNVMAGYINNNYIQGLSLWQLAYGSVKCNNNASCFTSAPKFPPYNNLTTEEKDQVWNMFKGLYAAARDGQVNQFIAANATLPDSALLVQNGYVLRFTGNNQQLAAANGWNWFPSTFGGAPNANIVDSAHQAQSTPCQSYIDMWKQQLLKCSYLAGLSNKDMILDTITARMVRVCQKGTDQANPYGSSNVAPNTPYDGSPRSFEEVINQVFTQYNIPKDNFCNPFTIEYPKPYGKGPKFYKDYTTLVDSCNCKQYAQIKIDATNAGYNPANLTSLNQYLFIKYGDTLTSAFYIGLAHCSEIGQLNYSCHNDTTLVLAPCDSQNPCGFATRQGTSVKLKDSVKTATGNLKTVPGTTKTPTDSTKTKDGQLRPLCPPGYHYDFTWGQCVPDDTPPLCPDGYHWDANKGMCVPDMCSFQCIQSVCDTFRTYYVALSSPQPLPDFLKCGFTGNHCISCDSMSAWTAEFKNVQFPSPMPQNVAPILDTTTNLSDTDLQYNMLWARFINYRSGLQYSWMDYLRAAANNSCNLANYNSNSGLHQNVICGNIVPLTDTSGYFVKDSACARTYSLAVSMAQDIYLLQKQTLIANFEASYRSKCLAVQNIETFTVAYDNKEYHYTLYYYDNAGNLVKTVPPKGVNPNYNSTFLNNVKTNRDLATNGQPWTAYVPSHTLTTNYRFNTLNQVITQNSPDAGTSQFWYDRLGRLVVSQNAQQNLDNKYSYTLYDELGRVSEVGQKPQTTVMTQTISQDDVALNNWINVNGGTREQITRTVYDLSYYNGDNLLSPQPLVQRNLRNRVSYVQVFDLAPSSYIGTHRAATYYTYDIHGNVDTLLQDYNGVTEMSGGNRYKKIVYDYDLVSGKVNMVSYQTGQIDAFYHRYNYDAENRLTSVETSRDKIAWETDAQYQYYKHGPLSRVVLGQQLVQGVDYAYTLQGWIKGMNSTNLDPNTDIGKDGTASSVVARDAIGYSLDYFGTGSDYKPINTGVKPFATVSGAGTDYNPLYNGNIAAMHVNIGKLNAPMLYTYGYDQLNRLVKMSTFTGLDVPSNNWNVIATNDYRENISYDPNGNILSYTRNGNTAGGSPLTMDNLTYNYYSGNNQLKQVADAVGNTNYTEDIDNQTNSSNYTYDAIGNMKTDASEGITSITWTVYGKIASIVKNGNTISYTYDASGNRITKTANGKTTVYARDASGNVMTVYEKTASTSLTQTEVHLYGSSRLGILGEKSVAVQTVALSGGFGNAIMDMFTRGEKGYELSNHLGNVLTTISDKKLQHGNNGSGGIDYFEADVVTAQDYYPFGMMMPGRKYTTQNGYRYGFNGKENDNEVKGEGNQQDYGMRIYDPRLGKFLSVDPLTEKYPWYTPYQFAGNMPVWAIDIDGLEPNKEPNTNQKIEQSKNNYLKIQEAINNLNYEQGPITGTQPQEKSTTVQQGLDNYGGGTLKTTYSIPNSDTKSFVQTSTGTSVHTVGQGTLVELGQQLIGRKAEISQVTSTTETTVTTISDDKKSINVAVLEKRITATIYYNENRIEYTEENSRRDWSYAITSVTPTELQYEKSFVSPKLSKPTSINITSLVQSGTTKLPDAFIDRIGRALTYNVNVSEANKEKKKELATEFIKELGGKVLDYLKL